jgi:UDP-2,4-diacetamido-2,4,6-trideoxy-beta-L-altropyranose hydrolase
VKIAFRVDASRMIGTGHVIRCLTLANELRRRGHEVHFISREYLNNLNHLIIENGFMLSTLSKPAGMNETEYRENYADWLGVPPEADANETITALHGKNIDWLIVDHYALNTSWQRLLRKHVKKIMVIDDLGNRELDCDLLLNQNFASIESHNQHQVPKHCKLALGTQYALLRPEYRINREKLKLRGGKIKRILVFFGGSDPSNLSTRTLQALSLPEFLNLEVDLVIGSGNANSQTLKHLASLRKKTTCWSGLLHLADLMQNADLSLGGGGATTWERMCLNLPSIVVILSENQRATCEALAREGLVINLGSEAQVDVSSLSIAIRKCLNSPDEIRALSERISNIVDGDGVKRIAELLESPLGKV